MVRIKVYIYGLILALLVVAGAAAQGTRPYFMGTAAIQAVPGLDVFYRNGGVSNSFSKAAGDSDVIAVFPEYLGIPFDEFARSSTIPDTHVWAKRVLELAAAVKSTGKPIVLQLVLTRDRLVGNAKNVGGQLVVDTSATSSACYNFAASSRDTIGTAFANYTTYMVRLFQPQYVVNMAEVNIYWAQCGGSSASWNKLVSIQGSSYTAARRVNSKTLVFPSFHLESMYKQSITGFDTVQWSAMTKLKRDRVGVSSFPFGLANGRGGIATPTDLPLDYLSRIRDRYPSEPPIVVAETGWNSASIGVGTDTSCNPAILPSDESTATLYLDYVINAARTKAFSGIVWWSNMDLIPTQVMAACYPLADPADGFSACNGEYWCQAINAWRANRGTWSIEFVDLAFKSFGNMGLNSYDGLTARSFKGLWATTRSTAWTGK